MVKLNYKKAILPPGGIAVYILLKVEEVENRFYDPKKDSENRKTQLEWHFVLDKDPMVTTRIWSTSNLGVYKSKKSKCLRLVETLLNKTLTDEEMKKFADTDSLIGKKIQLTIKHEKSENGIMGKVVDFEGISDLPF